MNITVILLRLLGVTTMLEEITQMMNLQVYTNKGAFLGVVDNIQLDMDRHAVDSFFIETPNPTLVEGSKSVLVPFRWVQSVGDIVILRFFPGRIELSPQERQMMMFERRQIPEYEG